MKIKTFAVLAIGALLMLFAPTTASAAEGDARIHLIHGIPDTNVDVIVDGDVVIEDFAFGDTNDLSSFSGLTLKGLKVNLTGTDTTAIDAGDVALPASGNFTVVAHLDAEGTPAIAVFENDVSKVEAGEGRLLVRHAAAAPAVDIKANGDVAFANVVNGGEGSADLPTGTISATVVPTGADEPVVIGPADLDIAEGEALIVYAVGSLEGNTLTVLTESITDLHSTPTEVNTGTSPVESSSNTLPLLLSVATATVIGGAAIATKRRMATVNA